MKRITKKDYIAYAKGDGYCWLNKTSNLLEAVKVDEKLARVMEQEIHDRKFEKSEDLFEAPFSAMRGNIFGEMVRYFSNVYAQKHGYNYHDLTDSFYEEYDDKAMAEQTRDILLREEKVIINEATFYIEIDGYGITSMVDMLIKDGDKIKIYEAKASTKVKTKHALDLYFQMNVINKTIPENIKVEKFGVMLINDEFVLQEEGNQDEYLQNYFKIYNLPPEFLDEFNYLGGKEGPIERYDGAKTEWDYVTSRISRNFEEDIKRIINIIERPVEDEIWKYQPTVWNEKLGEEVPTTRTWVDSVNPAIEYYFDLSSDLGDKNSENNILNKGMFDQLNKDYVYPLYMYDYESIEMSLPIIKGAKGYQQVISQYSIHIIKSPDFDVNDSSTYEHREFLIDEFSIEEVNKLWTKFVKDMDHGKKGTPVAWYKAYEQGKTKESLESGFVPAEYINDLENIRSRTIDLRDFFSTSKPRNIPVKAYEAPEWKGKSSIKLVGPHCAPDITYSNLKISNGSQALEFASKFAYNVWDTQTTHGFDIVSIINKDKREKSKQEWAKYREALLKYCEIDTKQMVGIWQYLNERFKD